jgi:phage conserved hypothetical protein, phiE125 gp8 family
MRLAFQSLEVDECITLDKAKEHCKIDGDTEDAYITDLITRARIQCENWCHTAILPQRVIAYLNNNDVLDFSSKSYLRLPYLNIVSIVSLKSYVEDGNDTLFPDGNYYLSGDRICLKTSSYLPTELRRFDAISVEFIAGFGRLENDILVEAVPETIKQAMLMLILHWHENRAAQYDAMNTSVSTSVAYTPHGVLALLEPYKRFSI